MLQNFIASSLNMFDTLMIGQLGENEVAAVGVANQVFFLFNLVANGAAAGCSIFLSQFWGGGDRRSVHKVVGLGLLMNLCIGLLFTGAACAFPGPIIGLFSDDQAVISLGIEYLLTGGPQLRLHQRVLPAGGRYAQRWESLASYDHQRRSGAGEHRPEPGVHFW